MRVCASVAVFWLALCGSAIAQTNTAQVPRLGDDAQARAIQDVLSEFWSDAVQVWSAYLDARHIDTETPQINFVPAVKASHCYGLYVSAGPVYCFGNSTVFVSLAEMVRLEARIPALGKSGLAFLVAHELGHHVQKVTNRFRLFTALVYNNIARQNELALRLELEADCLAGVWAGLSPKVASSGIVLGEMLSALQSIGDDNIGGLKVERVPDPASFTHGSSAQRIRWFKTGFEKPSIDSCDVLGAEAF